MTLLDYMIEEFDSIYDENVWFVASKNVLDGLTLDEAVWQPEGFDKSVWKLLYHLNYYNNSWLVRFRGGEFVHEIKSNDETFLMPDEPSEELLTAEINRFTEIMEGWRAALKTTTDDRISQTISETNDGTWDSLVSSINTHTAYHTGQIMMLRKMYGNWDPAKGVH